MCFYHVADNFYIYIFLYPYKIITQGVIEINKSFTQIDPHFTHFSFDKAERKVGETQLISLDVPVIYCCLTHHSKLSAIK